MLKQRGLNIGGIIFSGNEHKTTEEIIKKITKIPVLGRIEEEEFFNKQVIKKYADLFKSALENL